VLNNLGFFLRALNVVYSIADCERLMSDASTLAGLAQPTTLQVLNCTTDLNDVSRVIGGAKVSVPAQYTLVAQQAQQLVPSLALTGIANNVIGFQLIRTKLRNMRHSIATITPDLP